MKLLMHILTLSSVFFLLSGCIEQDSNTSTSEEDLNGTGCEIDSTLCDGSEVCTLVDPCGSSCEGEGPDVDCAAVCVEVYACVETLSEGERCNNGGAQCAEDLSCLVDADAGCEPSVCDGDQCTQDCIAIYTCQSTPIEPCDPEALETTCTDGKVCGIADFEEVLCDLCDVLPNPIFGCILPLYEDQECDQRYNSYGYDQCAEGLSCQSTPNDCRTCDDDGNCMTTCPTPLPSCQPEQMSSEEN